MEEKNEVIDKLQENHVWFSLTLIYLAYSAYQFGALPNFIVIDKLFLIIGVVYLTLGIVLMSFDTNIRNNLKGLSTNSMNNVVFTDVRFDYAQLRHVLKVGAVFLCIARMIYVPTETATVEQASASVLLALTVVILAIYIRTDYTLPILRRTQNR